MIPEEPEAIYLRLPTFHTPDHQDNSDKRGLTQTTFY